MFAKDQRDASKERRKKNIKKGVKRISEASEAGQWQMST